MGYKMFEIIQEKGDEILDHAQIAYEHLGKMLGCFDKMGGQSMGQREDMGFRDEMGYREDMGMRDEMGERRGVRGTGRYGMRSGYREPNPYYNRNY